MPLRCHSGPVGAGTGLRMTAGGRGGKKRCVVPFGSWLAGTAEALSGDGRIGDEHGGGDCCWRRRWRRSGIGETGARIGSGGRRKQQTAGGGGAIAPPLLAAAAAGAATFCPYRLPPPS